MAWTWLRACYNFNLRLFVGGVERVYPARWFFCDPDAQWFPSPHGAEASPWLKQYEVNLDWGDDGTLKKLDRGINPGYPGRCFVGDPQWFIDGQVPASLSTYQTPIITPCCGHVPAASTDPRCPAPPCQPDYFGLRTLVWTTSYGTDIWRMTGSGSGETQWGSPIFGSPLLPPVPFFNTFHLDLIPSPCLDSGWTLAPKVCIGGITNCFPMTFVSYDASTLTGIWNFPVGLQPQFGESVTLQWV